MIVTPFVRLFSAISALTLLAGANGHPRALAERTLSGPLFWAANLAGCICPATTNGGRGILFNIFPGYQCAYPSGACAWDDITGRLQNTGQGNCEESAPCAASGCTCPDDVNGDAGVLINYFKGWQCAYFTGGFCTYDKFGNVVDVAGTSSSDCVAAGACSIFD